jgi:hypothetical protein
MPEIGIRRALGAMQKPARRIEGEKTTILGKTPSLLADSSTESKTIRMLWLGLRPLGRSGVLIHY